VEQGGGTGEASWPPRLIPTPPATTVGLTTDVTRCQRRRGGGTTEASKPTRLSCQTASLFTGVDQSHQGGVRWVGGNCRGPMASQAATRALSTLPLNTRPSDVHCDASAIHMHACCARAPPPAVAPTTSRCHPTGSTHGGRGFVTGAMDFAAVGEKRGEGRGRCRDHMTSQAATRTLSPARHLLHPDHARRRWHHGRQDPSRR
jgi:hypothetical protein